MADHIPKGSNYRLSGNYQYYDKDDEKMSYLNIEGYGNLLVINVIIMSYFLITCVY